MKVADENENVMKKTKNAQCTGHSDLDVEISQIYIFRSISILFFNGSSVERRNRNKL